MPLLSAAVAYAIAPWGELVWDDQLFIKQQLGAIRTLADVLVPPADIPQWAYSYYRPVTILSYLIDQVLFGRGTAAGPHAANVLYHLLVTLFVWMLARRLLLAQPSGEWGALFAATLFAVHPIHTESVSWIAGRSDTLATMFLLPALLAILRWRDRGSIVALLAAPLLFFASLLAKEVALTGLALAPLLLALAPATGLPRRDAGSTRAGVVTWVAAAVAFVGAAALYWSLRSGAGSGGASVEPGAAGEIAARGLRALGYYLLTLAWPWPQSNFVPWAAAPGVVASVVILALALGLGVLALLARRRPGGGTLLIGIAWIPVTLAPAVAVALTAVAVTPLAERYLYLPSVGFALALGVVFARLHAGGHGRGVSVAAAAVLLAAGAATLMRGTVWLNDLRLWSDALRHSGEHATPLIEYGRAQLQAGESSAAEETFRRAMAAADTPRLRATAAYNVAAIAVTKQRLAEAERLFDAAVGLDPDYGFAHYGLGRIAYEQGLRASRAGDRAQAMESFERALQRHAEALRINPGHASAHLERSRVLASLAAIFAVDGDAGRAAEHYREALAHIESATAYDPDTLSRPEVQQLRVQVTVGLRSATREAQGL